MSSTSTGAANTDNELIRRVASLLDIAVANADELRQAQEAGLPLGVVDRLRHHGFSDAELGWILEAHRGCAASGRLTPAESFRLLQLAKVFCAAEAVMGSHAKAWEALRRPYLLYSGFSFIELCKSEVGAAHVLALFKSLHPTRATDPAESSASLL